LFTRVRLLLEMIRFSHTVFALPFALLAAEMAWREPGATWRWQDLAGVVLCMVFARGTAMAFNRLADRRLDARNPRTQSRHLPAGLLSVASVATFAILGAFGFVASTLLFLPGRWPLFLAVPVLAFLCGYSFAKRFTSLAHFWLGAALGLAPLAAWLAVRGEIAWPPAVLALAVMFWVAGFDIIYACQDVDHDVEAGLHSMPARLGVAGALRLAAICHLITVMALLALPYVYPELGWIYTAGICGVALLLAYEHRLVRPNDLARVNMAFFQINAVISIGLFFVGSVDLLVGRWGG
jgi:4-hydroxybenzoate polyprenyltransferase